MEFGSRQFSRGGGVDDRILVPIDGRTSKIVRLVRGKETELFWSERRREWCSGAVTAVLPASSLKEAAEMADKSQPVVI